MPVKLLVQVKGGAGSGNWGHAGRPGLRGGSGGSGGGSGAGGIDVDATLPSKDAVDKWVRNGNLEHDEEYILKVAGKVHEVKTEGWWDDCMESRGAGVTGCGLIQSSFEDIMVIEAGWEKADISGYVRDADQDPTFGVSYIGRIVK